MINTMELAEQILIIIFMIGAGIGIAYIGYCLWDWTKTINNLLKEMQSIIKSHEDQHTTKLDK